MNPIPGDPYLASGVELRDLESRERCETHDRPLNAYGQCRDCIAEDKFTGEAFDECVFTP